MLNPLDLDQVYVDIKSAKRSSQHESAKPAEGLPGLGRLCRIELRFPTHYSPFHPNHILVTGDLFRLLRHVF